MINLALAYADFENFKGKVFSYCDLSERSGLGTAIVHSAVLVPMDLLAG